MNSNKARPTEAGLPISDAETEDDNGDTNVILKLHGAVKQARLRRLEFTRKRTNSKSQTNWFYNVLVDGFFLESIVRETDFQAEKIILEMGLLKTKEYVGLGTLQLYWFHDYWETHRLFALPSFKTYMMFSLILRCLHISNDPVWEDKKETYLKKYWQFKCITGSY